MIESRQSVIVGSSQIVSDGACYVVSVVAPGC